MAINASYLKIVSTVAIFHQIKLICCRGLYCIQDTGSKFTAANFTDPRKCYAVSYLMVLVLFYRLRALLTQ